MPMYLCHPQFSHGSQRAHVMYSDSAEETYRCSVHWTTARQKKPNEINSRRVICLIFPSSCQLSVNICYQQQLGYSSGVTEELQNVKDIRNLKSLCIDCVLCLTARHDSEDKWHWGHTLWSFDLFCKHMLMNTLGEDVSITPMTNLLIILTTPIHDNSSFTRSHSYVFSGKSNRRDMTSWPQNFSNATPADEAQGGPLQWGMLGLTLIIACTAVGNLLVCLAVCWEKRLQNMTNYFLMSLAIADLLVSLLVMPLGMIVEIFGEYPDGHPVCWCFST